MDDSIQIRLATADDVADVQRCARAAYSKYILRMGREPAPMLADFAAQIERGHVKVVGSGASFLGYVVYYPENDHLHLENVAVHPQHTGKGIRKSLIQHVEQEARERGFDAVELYTNESMTENLVMYPKLGYVETGRQRQDGFNRVFFRKPL